MAYEIYQDHTVVSSAIYDQVSGKWMFDAYFTCLRMEGFHNSILSRPCQNYSLDSKMQKQPEWNRQKIGSI
jgi:hypothetical protein